MTTGTWQIAAHADDFSNLKSGGGGHTLTFAHTRIWSHSSGASSSLWGTLLRWTVDGADAPPARAIINSAYLEVLAVSDTNDELHADIHYLLDPPSGFKATDNPWTTYQLSPTKLVRSESGVSTVSFTQIDITDLVQEIVDTPGWGPGNTIGLAVLGNGDTTATLNIHTYSDPTDAAKLVIDWTANTDDPVIADAGADRQVAVGSAVQLVGTASDVDNTVTAGSWTMLSQPAGSNATVTLSQDTVPGDTASFVPDVPGDYRLRFTAVNDAADSAFDDITVTAVLVGKQWVTVPFAPTAPAGAVKATVRLVRKDAATGEVAKVRRVAVGITDPGGYTRPLSTSSDVVEVEASVDGANWSPVPGSPADLTGVFTDFFAFADVPEEVRYRARLVDPNVAAMTSPWTEAIAEE